MSMLNPLRRDASKPTLRQRAEALKATAARVMRGRPADQPSPATLPASPSVERMSKAFPGADRGPQDPGRGLPDDFGRADAAGGHTPRQGQAMGRHETFDHATSLATELLSGTTFTRTPVCDLPEPGSEEATELWGAALKEVDRVIREAREGYPELQGGPSGQWTKAELTKALDAREITPAKYARLHTLAAQREHTIECALVDTNVQALHVLKFAEDYSGPPEVDQEEPEAEAVDWHNPPPGLMAYPAIEPTGFINIREGLRLEAERLHAIAQAEFERLSEAVSEGLDEWSRAGRMDRLRRRFRVDALAAAARPEMPVPAGDVDARGFVYYEDAAGMARRRTVADWISFTAQRLYGEAQSEFGRQFNAGCKGLDGAGCRALDARLRCELRTDALFALAFQPHKVFEVAELARYGTEEGAAVQAVGAIDPVFEAIRVSAVARAALDQFDARTGDRRLSSDEVEEDNRLNVTDLEAREAVFEAVPTTRAGQIALLDYVRAHIEACGRADGEPAEGHETAWADGYRALEAALLTRGA